MNSYKEKKSNENIFTVRGIGNAGINLRFLFFTPEQKRNIINLNITQTVRYICFKIKIYRI